MEELRVQKSQTSESEFINSLPSAKELFEEVSDELDNLKRIYQFEEEIEPPSMNSIRQALIRLKKP